jgi:signal transduction histidine kinase/ActR/RegA family two-component response regulator
MNEPAQHLVGRHAATQHVVQFYEDDGYLIEVVGLYLARGLAGGERAIALATGTHRSKLTAKLAALGVDVDARVRAGDLVMLDAQEVLARIMVDDAPDWDRFEATIGPLLAAANGPICAFGELVNVLALGGNTACAVELERMWNRLSVRYPLSLLCGYHLEGFTRDGESAAFDEVCATHREVRPTEAWAALGDEHARGREVTLLQRRARALETEIARRRVLEDTLRESIDQEHRARADAEAANRAKDEFLAMLGHELRNPLTPIVTACELLKMRGDASRELDVIERQSGHIARLVDDLLDVSRISRGALEIRRERVEMWDVVADGVETASALLEQRRHVLAIEVPRRGCVVDGDRDRLAQVVSNLVCNAAKYSDPGSRIEIVVTGCGPTISLRVRDHGIGIAADMLERIFEAFVQNKQSIDRAQGGLGLGLAIVRSLVQLHSGSVTVRSDGPGAGSEFLVVLPAAPSLQSDRVAVMNPGGGGRVLVVEDNTDAAMLLAEALVEVGYKVKVAHDGPSALAIARDFVPDVGLIDIGLPVMDGYELAAHLRAEPATAGMRMIAITGYGQAADRGRARAAGFVEHLVKPVDLAAVKRLVAESARRG